MRRGVSNKVLDQQLKIQELVVRFADLQLCTNSGSHSIIQLGESISAIVSVKLVDDSASAVVVAQASACSIVDSTAYTAGGDNNAIKVANLQMAANDSFEVKYIALN
jgi:hypothetical protein